MSSPLEEVEQERQFDDVAGNNPNLLEIVVGDDNVVTLDLVNDLQEDTYDICSFLQNENCDKSIWLAISVCHSFILLLL